MCRSKEFCSFPMLIGETDKPSSSVAEIANSIRAQGQRDDELILEYVLKCNV